VRSADAELLTARRFDGRSLAEREARLLTLEHEELLLGGRPPERLDEVALGEAEADLALAELELSVLR